MVQLVSPVVSRHKRFCILLKVYKIINGIEMGGFVYSILAVLGAILIVVGIDAYIFIQEIASRQ
jgi:hypothetical protein